jgi:hypothetical protein
MGVWLADWNCHEDWSVNPFAEGYETAIDNRLGTSTPWHAFWEPWNWILLRTSLPWLFAQYTKQGEVQPEGVPKDVPPTMYVPPLYSDNDHVLLFPQDAEGLCPQGWLDAAYSFLARFRSNLSFYPQLAFAYRKVTLIGPPVGTALGIGPDVEKALKDGAERQVERIWVTSADSLAGILKARIADGVPFRGKDEGAPPPGQPSSAYLRGRRPRKAQW